MRISVSIDDGLLAQAEALAAPGMTRPELLDECLRAFIQRQAARRLSALGGQAPEVELAPRWHDDAS
jgi:metal-responsive CopG/Arc/MetJ family transcriptional regulator